METRLLQRLRFASGKVRAAARRARRRSDARARRARPALALASALRAFPPRPPLPQNRRPPNPTPQPPQVYSVSASPFFGGEAPSRNGRLRGDVAVAFSCAPEDRAALVDAALGVIVGLQEEGPTAEEAETVRCAWGVVGVEAAVG
jgi:hypothetical protein